MKNEYKKRAEKGSKKWLGGYYFMSNLSVAEGRFTQVPNEILEFLAGQALTPTEFRICIILIRELMGWDYKIKPIELSFLVSKTNIAKTHISEALKSLVKKNILIKIKAEGYRTPCYGFNEKKLGRVLISEPRSIFVDGSKVIDLKTFKLRKLGTSDYEISELERDKIRNFKKQERATRAASETPKYTQTHLNTLLEEKINKNDWEQVKVYLLTLFPNDESRLEGTYKQIKQNGFEQEGKPPRFIANLPAWLFASYADIRTAYSHHDRKKMG